MQSKRPNRPKEFNQLGKLIVDLATGNAEENYDKNEAAAEAGRKGAKGRFISMKPAERSKHATMMAKARWAD